MTGRRAMGAVDAIWLSMDSPENLMVIDSVLSLDGRLDVARLEGVVQRRLVDRYPVFSQVAVEPSTPLGIPHWEDDRAFSIEHHLHRVRLPEPADEAALRAVIEEKMQEPLDRRRPLWQLYLIDPYEGGSVVLARFHHALADGLALSQVLLAMTDQEPDGDLVAVGERASAAPRADPERRGLDAVGRLAAPVSTGVRSAVHLVRAIPPVLDPAHAVGALTTAWKAGQVADKLLLGRNPASPISGTPGRAKRAVWAEARSLADIKLVGRATGATVNDVLVDAVSAAINQYVAGHGGQPEDLLTMVPVNLRAAGQDLPRELGNKFALVMLRLPTGRFAPLQRLAETKRRMDAIKDSPEAALTFGLITAIGHTNTQVAKQLVDFFADKTIGVMTNVAGPTTGRHLAGTRVTGILAWVPLSGRQMLGVCIVSYDGAVRVGFKADAGVITDPDILVDALDDELDTLIRLAAAV